MAQHFLVDTMREAKVARSVRRIGAYIAKSSWLRLRKGFEPDSVYGKDIRSLGKEYHEDHDDFVISVGPYSLSKRMWGDNSEGAVLEAHFKRDGTLNVLYYPL